MEARKDNKGRALRKGEFQRASDGKYVYVYTDPNGERGCFPTIESTITDIKYIER